MSNPIIDLRSLPNLRQFEEYNLIRTRGENYPNIAVNVHSSLLLAQKVWRLVEYFPMANLISSWLGKGVKNDLRTLGYQAQTNW